MEQQEAVKKRKAADPASGLPAWLGDLVPPSGAPEPLPCEPEGLPQVVLQALRVEATGDSKAAPVGQEAAAESRSISGPWLQAPGVATFKKEPTPNPLNAAIQELRRQGMGGPCRADLGAVHKSIQAHDRRTWGPDPMAARATMLALGAALYFQGRVQHTWDAQSSALRTFDYFCGTYLFDPAPVTELTLVYYTVWSAARVSVGSIKKYVGHIRKRCEEEDIPMPKNDQMPRLRQIWDGLGRLQAAVKGALIRLPMTFHLCKKVYGIKQLGYDRNPRQREVGLYSMDHPLMASTVGATMLCGALRPGEATVRRTGSGVITRALRVKHLVRHEGYTTLKVPVRKTHQDGEDCDVVLGPTHDWFCAHSLLGQWLQARRDYGEEITAESFLFPVMDRSGKLGPLTYEVLTKHLTADLEAAGFSSEHYKGHSFRIGAATTMALNGVPDYWIEDLGNWARGSTAMRRYIHLNAAPEEDRARITSFLGRPFGGHLDEHGPARKGRTASASRGVTMDKSGFGR